MCKLANERDKLLFYFKYFLNFYTLGKNVTKGVALIDHGVAGTRSDAKLRKIFTFDLTVFNTLLIVDR